MDDKTKKYLDEHFYKLSLSFNPELNTLKEQIGINCEKLNEMKKNTDLIPSIVEIVTANGQGIEVLSNRLDKVE